MLKQKWCWVKKWLQDTLTKKGCRFKHCSSNSSKKWERGLNCVQVSPLSPQNTQPLFPALKNLQREKTWVELSFLSSFSSATISSFTPLCEEPQCVHQHSHLNLWENYSPDRGEIMPNWEGSSALCEASVIQKFKTSNRDVNFLSQKKPSEKE